MSNSAKIAAGNRPENHGTVDLIDGKLPTGLGPKEVLVSPLSLIDLAQGTPCFCSKSSMVAVNSFTPPTGEAAFHGTGGMLFQGQCKENGHQVEIDFHSKSIGWRLYSEAEEAGEAEVAGEPEEDDGSWEDIDAGEEDAEATTVRTKDQRSILALGLDGFVAEFEVPEGLFEEAGRNTLSNQESARGH